MSLRLLIVFGIVAMNGFFAAAEVALLSVRRSRLDELAAQGHVTARAALELLAHPEKLLSVVQVGVTLSSLGLGWAGEGTVFNLIVAALGPLITPVTEPYLHGLSFVLAFMAMTFVHVVLGEVVPKNLAIEKSDRMALLVAPVLLVFLRASAPFVFVIERAASAVSRLLGLREQGAGGHSSEELKFILEASHRAGHLEGFEQESMQRLLLLKDVYAREIMTPRVNIVSVSVDATLDELLLITLEHKYSRLPVYEDKPENIVGVVHYKDLMRAWRERKTATDARQPARPFRLRRYLRDPLVVPETKPLHRLVDEFRQRHTHLALVVDEFGTITGLVTMEDVLEQVFGEIGDEHDVRRIPPAAGTTVVEVDGTISILDLASRYGIELPGDAGFETLAGYLLFKLGYIPTPGDSVTEDGYTFTVQDMHRNRIARVKIFKQPVPAAAS